MTLGATGDGNELLRQRGSKRQDRRANDCARKVKGVGNHSGAV